MVDLHRHDEYSAFDGFGKAEELVKIAKAKGYTSLGTTNHGNTNGLVKHYFACKEGGIKPILGCEVYFKPVVDNSKPYYHLCLFAKTLEGYRNLNEIITKAEQQKYYKPIVTFKELKDFNKGLICSTACVAGFAAKLIINKREDLLEKYLLKMKKMFGDDFYIEIQPYKISDVGVQELVNKVLLEYGKKLGIKCILTSDSHYGDKDDFDSYLKMHEIAKHDVKMIEDTYKERYMPTEEEIKERFVKMHSGDFKNAKKLSEEMIVNLQEIEDKVDGDLLDKLEVKLPKFETKDGKNQFQLLVSEVKKGLKKRGKYIKEYIERCKEELDVIKHLHFENYFLIVQDYVRFSKENGIPVGPGRGSGCNSLVNYALGITEVDSLLFGLDFRRFLRKDKVKMPDIDLDFATNRRHEVINYLINKYDGMACRICSYGLYKVDNLINDLAKVCGLDTTGDIEADKKSYNKKEITKIKEFINKYIEEGELDAAGLLKDKATGYFNGIYDNIIKHFTKLYKKVRFIGTHAAGVAITDGSILDYTAIRLDKSGDKYANYDLTDLELIKVIKFDILGLGTMEELGELREMTGSKGIGENEDWVKDKKVLKNFYEGNTDGIFQFEKRAAKDILNNIQCNCFDDIVAASSMNRPGPLMLKMPEMYAENKRNIEEAKKSKYWKYTKETYGTVIYQEQIQQMCVGIGEMPWQHADKVIKMQKGGSKREYDRFLKSYEEYKAEFLKGAVKHGYTEQGATELFDKFFNYSFNKGHGVGYSLISVEEMYYKTYHPTEFWLSKLRTEGKEDKLNDYRVCAVQAGCLIMPPHVNGSVNFELRKIKGDTVIQEGIQTLKGIGQKTAEVIIKNGPYIDFPDFEDKMQNLSKDQKRAVTKKTIDILKASGALEFRDKMIYKKAVEWNTKLYARKVKEW